MTKEEKREYKRQWYLKNREKRLEQMKEWREVNKEKIAERSKEYYQENKEERKEYNRKYYQKNKEKRLEQQKEYRNTQMGRALYLLNRYNQSDKEHNRGQGDLTAKWIVENIFTKPCKYCGENNWEEIGCNRIDNDKPHSKDNVEPCCEECNKKLPKKGDN